MAHKKNRKQRRGHNNKPSSPQQNQQQKQQSHDAPKLHDKSDADPIDQQQLESQLGKQEPQQQPTDNQTEEMSDAANDTTQQLESKRAVVDNQIDDDDNNNEELNQLEAQEPDQPTSSVAAKPPTEQSIPPPADAQLDQLETQEPVEVQPSVDAETQVAEEPMPSADDTSIDAPMDEPDAPGDEPDEHDAQRQLEFTKLQAIESHIQQIRDKLTTRLPLQRRLLAARVCGAIWAARVRFATIADASEQQTTLQQLTKKLRMELGAFDYQTKEQGELLTRELCALDDILSFGDAAIKSARKALVVAIQTDALPLADALREQGARLKAFGDEMLAKLAAVVEAAAAAATASNANTAEVNAPTATASDSAASDKNGDDDAISDDDDDDDDDRAFANPAVPRSPPRQQLNEHHRHPHYQQPCTASSSLPPAQQPTQQQQQKQQVTCQPAAADIQSLPIWRPYYQLQKRSDGLYLIANLRGVEPTNVHVEWLDRVGVLRVSGYKLPTQKDLAVSRFSGVPTFGRFAIAEHVPVDVLAMHHATQALRADGTLEIRMPFNAVRQQRMQQLQPNPFMRRAFFDSPRQMFW